MRKGKTILALFLVGAMSIGLAQGMSANALAEEEISTYTLTIPSSLRVTNVGWNNAGGIRAKGALTDGQMLVVSASSDGEFALVNQADESQKVAYKFTSASPGTGAEFADVKEKNTWKFFTLSQHNTTLPAGIVVDDYRGMPDGTYRDTVTFFASVEPAKRDVSISTSPNVGSEVVEATEGMLSQANLSGAMITTTIQIKETARSSFVFQFEDIAVNGVTAHRVDDHTVTVSGTPTADVEIVLPIRSI